MKENAKEITMVLIFLALAIGWPLAVIIQGWLEQRREPPIYYRGERK